ncbi:hypothetical protein E4U22_003973 [Claviceps purpurea]|uniref:Imidazoleglycerol-phosphate dehydratase n=1 Tax=Claviceps purpurea (strain 20.1) TaxID=1111077 RepID=M1WAE5_CLAP2|nr:hypothetical protein E4U12_007422 [Claviceps purpurea]CCE27664.1 uncharacterized protein CPUR_01138 [Claviceps purpurea 20.1]KAG6148442.1 hypothetical protein E4U28_004307 [Claviceps purpurea]KAG6159044.1 hypothetical protein E4U37_004504 [Claviceps purpurea]KAG6161437.1 hypothetical protein E4U51_007126 [Claviceps purpurea]
MRSHDPLRSEEVEAAGREAGKGALVGAAKWGLGAAVLGAIGYKWWPVYRGTTIQYKIYLQLSGMILGGMLGAESRMRQYEYQMRMQRRWMQEKTKWQRYEEEFGQNEGGK